MVVGTIGVVLIAAVVGTTVFVTVGVGGTEGLATSLVLSSRRRLTPLEELSLRPNEVAFMRI